jgi:hypothetical protein
MKYRWEEAVEGFKMPLIIEMDKSKKQLECSASFKEAEIDLKNGQDPKFKYGLYRVVEIKDNQPIEKYW